jgi:hypothetical protein
MNSREKSIAFASFASIVVGIVVTISVWGLLGFDMNQVTAVLTLILLCFLLAGAQALGPTPTCELEILCGPRQVAVPGMAVGMLWLFQECGIDYTAFGQAFGPRHVNDVYIPIGVVAGYFACQVYIMAALWMRDPRDC